MTWSWFNVDSVSNLIGYWSWTGLSQIDSKYKKKNCLQFYNTLRTLLSRCQLSDVLLFPRRKAGVPVWHSLSLWHRQWPWKTTWDGERCIVISKAVVSANYTLLWNWFYFTILSILYYIMIMLIMFVLPAWYWEQKFQEFKSKRTNPDKIS